MLHEVLYIQNTLLKLLMYVHEMFIAIQMYTLHSYLVIICRLHIRISEYKANLTSHDCVYTYIIIL